MICTEPEQQSLQDLGGAILEPRVEMVLKLLVPPITLIGILVLLGQRNSFVVREIGLA